MSYGFDNIAKVPELQKRIIFTLLMLFVYRMGIHIPTPGIDSVIMKEWFDQQQGTLLGMFDMFTGGGFRSLSIFALGVMPYISSSIIVQLLCMIYPPFEQLQRGCGRQAQAHRLYPVRNRIPLSGPELFHVIRC